MVMVINTLSCYSLWCLLCIYSFCLPQQLWWSVDEGSAYDETWWKIQNGTVQWKAEEEMLDTQMEWNDGPYDCLLTGRLMWLGITSPLRCGPFMRWRSVTPEDPPFRLLGCCICQKSSLSCRISSKTMRAEKKTHARPIQESWGTRKRARWVSPRRFQEGPQLEYFWLLKWLGFTSGKVFCAKSKEQTRTMNRKPGSNENTVTNKTRER